MVDIVQMNQTNIYVCIETPPIFLLSLWKLGFGCFLQSASVCSVFTLTLRHFQSTQNMISCCCSHIVCQPVCIDFFRFELDRKSWTFFISFYRSVCLFSVHNNSPGQTWASASIWTLRRNKKRKDVIEQAHQKYRSKSETWFHMKFCFVLVS